MLSSQNWQKNTLKQDSILISKRHFDASSNAFIELKNLKKEKGQWQGLVHEKDVSIQFYEWSYKKCQKSDSLSSILIKNKDKEIEINNNLISEYKREVRIQKAGKIASSILVPVVGILGGLLGYYLHQ